MVVERCRFQVVQQNSRSPIPPHPDPRGRRARFCSGACRAAAHRAHKDADHAVELETARKQLARPVEPTSPTTGQLLDDAAEALEAVTMAVEQGARSVQLPRLLVAALTLVEAAGRQGLHAVPAPAPQRRVSRQQRRAAERGQNKK